MDAASPIPDPQAEAAAERAARQGVQLRELAAMGMDIAREVHRQAVTPVDPEAAPAPAPPRIPGDPALLFARVSRAVRQTLMLETRLAEEHQVRAARAADMALDRSHMERHRRHAERRSLIRGVVEEVIENCADSSDLEDLRQEWDERMEGDELNGDLFSQPVGAIVAEICAELGVTPDWRLWEDETWARAEAAEDLPGSPFARSAGPPPGDGPDGEADWGPDPTAGPDPPRLLEHHPP